MARLPLVIFGAGSIGMRHVGVARDSDAVTIVAIVEPDEGKRERLDADGLPAVAGIEDVPAAARAAIVATPTPDHHDTARACLRNGWATLVEKPLAATIGEARALIAAAGDTPLVTGHHRRCHPFAIRARALLSDIGAPVGVQGLWSLRKHDTYYDEPWRTRPGAGPLMTNLSHEIDLLHFLLGPITVVSALISSARRELAVEDTASLSFRFASGALGSFLISDAGLSPWAFEAGSDENPAIAGSDQDYLRFVGTEGALAFPSLTRWSARDGAAPDWTAALATGPGPGLPRIDPIADQLRRFALVAMGGQDDVLATGEDGLRALEWTLAAALSGRTKKRVSLGGVPDDYRGT